MFLSFETFPLNSSISISFLSNFFSLTELSLFTRVITFSHGFAEKFKTKNFQLATVQPVVVIDASE